MLSVTTGSGGRSRAGIHFGNLCALITMVVVLCPVRASAQCVEQQKLTASDAGRHVGFGNAICVSGDTAVIGARADDCAAGRDCGSAYVFRFDGTNWVEEQKLTASDAAPGDNFGWSVSLTDKTAVVGAVYGASSPGVFSGSAYVFRFNGAGWIEEQKLVASDAAAADWFGGDVLVHGECVIVGASGDDCAVGDGCGAAYVYCFDGTRWIEEQKLTASDAAGAALFGSSVSVSGDTLLAGAYRDPCASGFNCGSTYVFRFDGASWVEERKLTAFDAVETQYFGWSVSVGENLALVGARRDGCAVGPDCGAAYVFRFNGQNWVEEQMLIASDAAENDAFGHSLSVEGNTALVAAVLDDCSVGLSCGAAYFFHFNGSGWTERQKVTASDTIQGHFFASSVSISRNTALIGAPGDACAAGSDCGAAYVFSCAFGPTDVNLDIKPGGCPNVVNPKSKGVLPVALVGSQGFDVAMVNPESLTLARADGVGESVSPLSGRRGLRMAIEDVATPVDGEPCDCHDLGPDGMDDLSIKFSTPELTRAFALDAWPPGETIELVLRGSLQDGTTFEASDCIVMPGSPRPERFLHRPKSRKP